MRKFRALLVSVALGASLAAGCSQGSGAVGAIDVDPNAIEAHVTKLISEPLKGTATAAADLEPLRAMLPPEVALSWGALSFDAATGSTLITNLKLTPKDTPTVGVQVSELRLWDFDAKLLQDRINGQRLGETAPLARRIDAKGVSLFGIADLLNAQAQSMMPADFNDFGFPDDAMPEEPADDAAPLKFQPTDPTEPVPVEQDDPFSSIEDLYNSEPMMSVERYDVSIGRIIIDDVMLKPYQVAPAPAAANAVDPYDPMAMLMPALQQISAITTSYGIDTAAYLDFKIDFAMTQYGQKSEGNVGVAAMGARGLRGGDIDGMFLRDLKFGGSGDMGMGASTPVGMQYSIANMTLEDMRLEKILGYIAKGVMPPRTETNLMSLGVWRSQNESLKMGGKEIYSMGESMFDGSGWHWFIPTKLVATGKNMSLDFGAILEFGQQMNAAMMGDFGSDDPFYAEQMAAEQAQMQQMMATLNKHGLSKLSGDYNFGWNWNAGNGDTKLDLGFDGKDMLQLSATYQGAFPSFKAVSDLIPEDGPPNEAALMGVFSTDSTLKLIELNVNDKGGLPKIFGFMGDMAPQMGMAPEPMTGDQVRAMAVEAITMAARPDVSGIPELGPLMTPVASFVREGGKLRIALQPIKPMPFSSLMGTVMMAGMGSPAQAIKDLGLKVEHSK